MTNEILCFIQTNKWDCYVCERFCVFFCEKYHFVFEETQKSKGTKASTKETAFREALGNRPKRQFEPMTVKPKSAKSAKSTKRQKHQNAKGTKTPMH